MKTIDEALDYLYSFINYEVDSTFSYEAIQYNVERTVKLLELLNHPQGSMDFIHVAGTKGKGSVCAIIDSLLQMGHHTTGLFTSPHIDRVNERIAVSGHPIEDRELVRLIDKLPPLIDTFQPGNLPTTFEILTAIAIYHFTLKGVEYGILETGMGGRFDSTNFCNPLISIITPISFDHMDKLGDRIEDIAFEKAGIIKRGKPVVLGYQPHGARDILLKRAKEEGSPSYETEILCSFNIHKATERGTRFSAVINGRAYRDLFLSLPGKHQVENVVTAMLSLMVLDLLPENHAVKGALDHIRLPARLELIQGRRRFLLDSAHNEDSARVLVEALRNVYTYDKLYAVVGIVKGKDIRGILRHVASLSERLIITEPVTHKELDTEAVFNLAVSYKRDALLIKDIEDAIACAVDSSSSSDIILITGSFYITSPARAFILRYR